MNAIIIEQPRREFVLPSAGHHGIASAEAIAESVALRHGVQMQDLLRRDRHGPLVRARQEAIYFVRELTGLSYPEIGGVFDRDHSTVMHSVRKHRERLANES